MLKLPSFIKTPSYRRFEFKTRYYNADQEAFNERVSRAKKESGSSGISEVEAIKLRMKDKYQSHRNKKTGYNSRLRMFRIISLSIVLAALTYWILK